MNWRTVDESESPLDLPVKLDAWLVDHAAPGDPPLNPNASYKSHARLRIGGDRGWDSEAWILWIGVGNLIWPVQWYDSSIWPNGGLVFSRRNEGDPDFHRGTSYALSRTAGHDDPDKVEAALNAADRFILFAVSPDGLRRTRVWECQNDQWINGERFKPPAKKLRRSRVPPEGAVNAPAPEFELDREVVDPDPEPRPKPPNDLRDVVIAGNSAQNIRIWNTTSRMKRIRVSDGGICMDHTKRGAWPEAVYGSNGTGDPMEGSPWIIATIDGVRHAGTFEWMRPSQECKALGTKPPATVIADVLGDHIKWGPLANWKPRPGEWVQIFMSTVARNGEQPPIEERSNLIRFQWPQRGESIDIRFPEEPVEERPEAPSGLFVGQPADELDRVIVGWDDNSDNETGFILEMRHPGAISWAVIARPGPGSTTLAVMTDPDTTYEFRVKATGTAGDSDYSNVVTVTTPKRKVPMDLACASGHRLKELREEITGDLVRLALDLVGKWPPSLDDLRTMIPRIAAYWRGLREVEDDLLGTCKEK